MSNIWIINQDVLTPAYGYMQHRHFFLAREFVKAGENVSILTSTFNHYLRKDPPSKNTYNSEQIDDVDFCWIKGSKYTHPNGIKRVISWIVYTICLFFIPVRKLGKPDVIIFSSTGLFPFIAAYYYKLKFNCQLVAEIRDIWPKTLMDLGNIGKNHPLVLFIAFLEKMVYKKADKIVGTMPNLVEHVNTVLKMDCSSKVFCIPQGIDKLFLESLKELDNDFLKKYLPGDKFIIGYAGAIGTSNALDSLIEASNYYKGRNNNIHIIILGDGPKKDELITRCKGIGNITFAPKIPKKYVNAFLEKCDILFDGVHKSEIYKYGLSRNKWIDYMYSGRPIVAEFSGYVSMINEANCGMVCPVGDFASLIEAINHLSSLPKADLDAMGARGKEFILKYRTFDKLGKEYLSLIKNNLEQHLQTQTN